MTYQYLSRAADALRRIHREAMDSGSQEGVLEGGVIASLITTLELLMQNEERSAFSEEAARVIMSNAAVFGHDEWLRAAMADPLGAQAGQVPERLARTRFYRELTGRSVH